jgi:hypothetical protein
MICPSAVDGPLCREGIFDMNPIVNQNLGDTDVRGQIPAYHS